MLHRFCFGCTLLLALLSGCQEDYDALAARELASGVRHDSLFLGLSLGMSQGDFYQQCWQLNQQGLVTNGPENNTVLYKIADFEHTVDMNFYPAFEDERIYLMGIVFYYEAWAPWNRQLFAPKLLPHILDLMTRWYGGTFMELKTPTGTLYWAQVQGNREITVRVQNEKNVRVEIRDLTVTPTKQERPQPSGPRPLWEKTPE